MKEPKLTCADLEILSQDYLDGYILASQRRDLEEHLAGCPDCRTGLLRMKRLEEQLEGSLPVEVPQDLERIISGSLPLGLFSVPWARKMARLAGVGIAGIMGVVLVVLLLYPPRSLAPGGREVEIVFNSPGAQSVHVAGDFNDWNRETHPMYKTGGGAWRLTLHLPPGLYQYNFYIDSDRWAADPGAQTLVSDGFGGRNALIFVEG